MAKDTKDKTPVTPTYLKGKRPIKVSIPDVIAVLKMIEEHGHSEKLMKASKKSKAFVSVHPDTVNMLKDFVVLNEMHAHPLGTQVVNPQACDDAECKFKRRPR